MTRQRADTSPKVPGIKQKDAKVALCVAVVLKPGDRIIEVNHRLNQYKRQARERLLSEEGIKHRGRRCIEPEAVFGQMKYNMAYRRFRHVGEDKVTMDFAFFAIAFNIKKMCAKLIKEGKGIITVAKYMFMGLFITQDNWNIATCCQMHEEKAA